MMLYLYLLTQNQTPTQALAQRTLERYREAHGPEVMILGGHRVTGPFPREPDRYVVAVCIEVCKSNNIPFNPSAPLEYGVYFDLVDGEEVGVCQMVVEAASAPTLVQQGPDSNLSSALNMLHARGSETADRSAIEIFQGGAEDDTAAWEPGQIILGLYEVVGVLGEGGMGKVYKVRHLGWEVDLAVKSPRPEIFARPGGLENFEAEAKRWVNLGLHPHVVSCHYVRSIGDIPRVFAEYVEGGSLSDWIRQRRLYGGGREKSLGRMLDIAIQFAWGLQYAHEQGLVHQDVKPANVMMKSHGTVKVTDFGLARARERAGEGPDMAGQDILVSCGGMTRAYCSPEQARLQPLSLKTDIWSWGVSVLEMFTGKVTWRRGELAAEALDLYLSLTGGQAASSPELPLMPASLAHLLRRCFHQEPARRPNDMLEIIAELDGIYAETTRRDYQLRSPGVVELQADDLNNRALSLLDLGEKDGALLYWEKARAKEPLHPESTYNSGVVLWQLGEQTDEQVVRKLEAVATTNQQEWKAPYFLGLVHRERGDQQKALSALGEAARRAPHEQQVARALKAAQLESRRQGHLLRVFEGHGASVNSVCLSADEHLALSGSDDTTLRVWDVGTGECLRVMQEHGSYVGAVYLGAGNRFALSGSADRTLRLWDVSTGRCLRVFEGHTGEVHSVCLSADGRFALSGGADMTLRLWDVMTGKCLSTLRGHAGAVRSVCISGDGRFALSGSEDRTLRLWELRTRECRRIFDGHSHYVTSVHFSKDATLALSGSWDTTLRLWDVTSGHCVRICQGHAGSVNAVSLSGDGRFALSGDTDGSVRWWDVATGRCLYTFERLNGHVAAVSLGEDCRGALSGGGDGDLRLWQFPEKVAGRYLPLAICRARSGGERARTEDLFQQYLSRASEALVQDRLQDSREHVVRARSLPGCWPRSEAVAIWTKLGRKARRVGLRDVYLRRSLRGHEGPVNAVAISRHSRVGVSGGRDKAVLIWDLLTCTCQRVLKGHTESVNSVWLSEDGTVAVSGSSDGSIRVWQADQGEWLGTFDTYSDGVASVDLCASHRLAIAGSDHFSVRLFTSLGMTLRTFEQSSTGPRHACLSRDGALALATSGHEAHLFEVATGRRLHSFKGHTASVYAVSFSVDGRLALTGGQDKTLRLWAVPTGQCLRVMNGHSRGLTSVSLSGDKRFAVSGSADTTIRIWDLTTGECIRCLEGHGDSVTSVVLSAGGRFILSGSKDGTLGLWELEWELEFPEPADWDEGARPHLETFLNFQTPYAAPLPEDRNLTDEGLTLALSRRGEPAWEEGDFQVLLQDLQFYGFGWLRPEGVRRELEAMKRERVKA